MIAYEEREIREAWQAVANAKLIEFRRQAWRLALLVSAGKLKMADAVDGLWEIATAHALVRSLGEDRVQAILAEAFTVARFAPQRGSGCMSQLGTFQVGSRDRRMLG
jgi:hypothetical protein